MDRTASTAVLLSAGLDSAVLAAAEARTRRVHPIYVSTGMAWERSEKAALDRLLACAPFSGRLDPLAHLSFPARDVYAENHWALRGEPPAFDTPDEDVYLTGRNLVLLTKAGVIASQQDASRIALGPLAGNPFPDARPEFFDAMSRALSLGLGHSLEIAAPFLGWHKEDVIRRGVELKVPLEHTLSCMNPAPGPRHCGLCSKCRERRDAFAAAGISDPTAYANQSPR